MIILGNCFSAGYHVTAPWGIEGIADAIYRKNKDTFHAMSPTINSSFNEHQDRSILNTAGTYMFWWLDENIEDIEITSETIFKHFEMYLSEVR